MQTKKLIKYAKYAVLSAKIDSIDAVAGCGNSKTKTVTIIAMIAS
nr:hypothetical protein [Methanobrevibacter sp. UBA212]